MVMTKSDSGTGVVDIYIDLTKPVGMAADDEKNSKRNVI